MPLSNKLDHRRETPHRNFARNSIEQSFNKVRKRCNSNDHNSNHEITARELRATLLGNRNTTHAAGVKDAGGPGGPDYGAHGRRGQAPRKVARNSIA